MKTLAGVLMVAAVGFASGCARSDWIERTLVTADVTGAWSGKAYIPHAAAGSFIDLRLELQQEGPKVKGSIRPSGSIPWRTVDVSPTAGPINGTVAGDVFRFREVNGHITGELTISGDEMAGEVMERVAYWAVLRRVSSASSSMGSPGP